MSVRRASKGRVVRKIDWVLFSIYLGLVALGSATVYSVTFSDEGIGTMNSLWATPAGKQIMWVGISLVTLGIIQFINGKFWEQFAFLIYGVAIILLLLVPFLGTEIKGATSWFRIGSFGFQPSEVAKFATCLALASYVSNHKIDLSKGKYLLVATSMIIFPILLILLQPDAGSALIFLSFAVLFYRAGMSGAYIYIGFSVGALLLIALASDQPLYLVLTLISAGSIALLAYLKNPFYWIIAGLAIIIPSYFFIDLDENSERFILLSNIIGFAILGIYHYVNKRQRLAVMLLIVVSLSSGIAISANYAFNNFLEAHQQERINMWIRPDKCDPSGPLYNVIQSKVAIGSGGFEGKGFFKGTLTKLDYVPEQYTDFIFCAIGEEHGFIGTLVLIFLFLAFFWRILHIAERQKSNFTRYYAYGIVGIFFLHFFINIGMTMGIMPIIGIPLPFISKGGSSLLGFTIMIAVLLNLDSRRYVMN
ncbi:MAG: rod shape-determining protein RodA [Bacteroidota bacterium]